MYGGVLKRGIVQMNIGADRDNLNVFEVRKTIICMDFKNKQTLIILFHSWEFMQVDYLHLLEVILVKKMIVPNRKVLMLDWK